MYRVQRQWERLEASFMRCAATALLDTPRLKAASTSSALAHSTCVRTFEVRWEQSSVQGGR